MQMRRSEMIFTQDQLNTKLAEWQKILRLQDWDITVSIKRGAQIGAGCASEVDVVLPLKQAVIRIVDPEDFPSDAAYPQDMEKTLVHELLHVHLWAAMEDLPDHKVISEEQAVSAISNALVNLYSKMPTTAAKKKPVKSPQTGVNDVVQVKNPRNDRYVKINRLEGRIVSHKKSPGPYKNIPRVGDHNA